MTDRNDSLNQLLVRLEWPQTFVNADKHNYDLKVIAHEAASHPSAPDTDDGNYQGAMADLEELIRVCLTNTAGLDRFLADNYPKHCASYSEKSLQPPKPQASDAPDVDEVLERLGDVLYMLADLHPDDQCRTYVNALAFYNEHCPDAPIAGEPGYTSRLVNTGPMDSPVKRPVSLFVALERLVSIKEHKDKHGKDAYYEFEQPIAWRMAKEALDGARDLTCEIRYNESALQEQIKKELQYSFECSEYNARNITAQIFRIIHRNSSTQPPEDSWHPIESLTPDFEPNRKILVWRDLGTAQFSYDQPEIAYHRVDPSSGAGYENRVESDSASSAKITHYRAMLKPPITGGSHGG